MRDALLLAVTLRDVLVALGFWILMIALAIAGGMWVMHGAGTVEPNSELSADDDDPERTVEVYRPRTHRTGTVCVCQSSAASSDDATVVGRVVR